MVGVVEWWSDGVVEWWSDGVVGVMEWWEWWSGSGLVRTGAGSVSDDFATTFTIRRLRRFTTKLANHRFGNRSRLVAKIAKIFGD